jgi:pimeloyl-ACP methyl ester carboxylesterase
MTDATMAGQMGQVISTDGTPIAYRRSGEGPPLVLIHGTAGNHARWAPILPPLEERFTVYAVDRRGRGASGDAPTYSIEREVEDVTAVVDSTGGPVDLLGHSYGALCALEAALRTDRLRRLVLYEPPIPAGIEIYPGGIIERLEALLEAGDREELLTTFFREVIQMPAHEIELMRVPPFWQARLALAHTLPRELRGSQGYVFEPARFSQMRTPSLLLLGSESPPFLKAATAVVHAALPTSRIAVLAGQQHIAMNTAPELFVDDVVRFLTTD